MDEENGFDAEVVNAADNLQDEVVDTSVGDASETLDKVDPTPTQKKSDSVPYDRFKEVNDKNKQYEDYIRDLLAERRNPATDISADENGYVDPQAIILAAKNEAVKELRAEQAEQEQWSTAVKKHPELDGDKDLENAVKGMRTSVLITSGELISYEQAADRLLGKLKKSNDDARKQGAEEVLVSETIQSRARIAPSSNSNGEEEERAALQKMMGHPDNKIAEKARIKYLSKYFQ